MIAQLWNRIRTLAHHSQVPLIRPPAYMALCISVGSKGDSDIPPYEVYRSQWTASINFLLRWHRPRILYHTSTVESL